MHETLSPPASPLSAAEVVPAAASRTPVAGGPAEALRQAQLRRQLLALLGHEPAGHPPAP